MSRHTGSIVVSQSIGCLASAALAVPNSDCNATNKPHRIDMWRRHSVRRRAWPSCSIIRMLPVIDRDWSALEGLAGLKVTRASRACRFAFRRWRGGARFFDVLAKIEMRRNRQFSLSGIRRRGENSAIRKTSAGSREGAAPSFRPKWINCDEVWKCAHYPHRIIFTREREKFRGFGDWVGRMTQQSPPTRRLRDDGEECIATSSTTPNPFVRMTGNCRRGPLFLNYVSARRNRFASPSLNWSHQDVPRGAARLNRCEPSSVGG